MGSNTIRATETGLTLAAGLKDNGDPLNRSNPASMNTLGLLTEMEQAVAAGNRFTPEAKTCMQQKISGVKKDLAQVIRPGFVSEADQQAFYLRAVNLGNTVEDLAGKSVAEKQAIACGK
ncbi:MAG: hypothetical protein IT384_23295 [Deltaproteobacteria bacterium]|nr:hypothetical protein [Deltaproteobacteria bacterium]